MNKSKNNQEYFQKEEYKKRINNILKDDQYAQQSDDDSYNPWLENKDMLKGNISRFHAAGIQLTSALIDGNVFKDGFKPSDEQIKLMQKFLLDCIGNLDLNAFLKQDSVLPMSMANYFTSTQAINQIAYLTFKTRNLANLGEAIDKLDKAFDEIAMDKNISDENKITLKEFAIVSDLAKLHPILSLFNQMGVIAKNETLEDLFTKAEKAAKVVEYYNSEINKSLNDVGAGVLILDNSYKKSDILSFLLTFFERIMAFFSKYGHASMLHVGTDAVPKKFHINPHLELDVIGSSQYLYSSFYKIDPCKLIETDNKDLLEELYGDNWKEKIAAKFKVIENDLHANHRKYFLDISAAKGFPVYMSGIADIIPFGHKKLSQNDFKEMHRKVMENEFANGTKKTQMLCSEFTAITIIASLVELNKQIMKDIKKKAPNTKDIDIVKIPFGKHEDLHRLHPQRLLQTLKKYHCVSRVSAKSIDQFFKPNNASKIKHKKDYKNHPVLNNNPDAALRI